MEWVEATPPIYAVSTEGSPPSRGAAPSCQPPPGPLSRAPREAVALAALSDRELRPLALTRRRPGTTRNWAADRAKQVAAVDEAILARSAVATAPEGVAMAEVVALVMAILDTVEARSAPARRVAVAADLGVVVAALGAAAAGREGAAAAAAGTTEMREKAAAQVPGRGSRQARSRCPRAATT